MIEQSSLDAIKANLLNAKKHMEQMLQGLYEKRSKFEGATNKAPLKEIDKLIKKTEKSLKAFKDL